MKTKLALAFALCAALSVATPLFVANPSFETATLTLNAGNGPFSQLIAGSPFGVGGTLNSWAASSTTSNAQAGAFAPTSGGINWTTKWWDANNVGYVIAFQPGTVSLSQTLTDTLLSNTSYTLTVDIGRRILAANFNYAIQVFAGTTLLASASNLSLANNSSGTDFATYFSPVGNPLAGNALKIVLLTNAGSAGTTEAFFDNVRLDAASATVPEPGTLAMLSAGLAAILATCRRRPSRMRKDTKTR